MGMAASVSRNIVHLFVSKLFVCQAQQYLVPLDKFLQELSYQKPFLGLG